jgi:hypothetical protein
MMSLKTGREQRQTGDQHFVPTKVTGTNRHVKKIAALQSRKQVSLIISKTGLLFKLQNYAIAKLQNVSPRLVESS